MKDLDLTTESDRLQDLFAVAAELDSEGARDRYLDQACGEEPELRRLLDELLRAHDQAGSFLRDEDDAGGVDDDRFDLQGTKLGPYELVERLGEGGFGVVYLAQQDYPVRRRVALKIIKPGMDSREVIARFNAERQALALMDHPHIAKVLGAGTTEQGNPYFVMELFEGLPITQFCDRRRLGIRPRLRLFCDVCRAVQHAHQKGIIHRDLKPSNILVSEQQGQVWVKVIDFGVAKALHASLTDHSVLTRQGNPLGTPLYMSPEQAASMADVDTRSDIYSLGVLLYELLTAKTPLDRSQLQHASLEGIRRILESEDPVKPSSRILAMGSERNQVATDRGLDSRRLGTLIRGDLDWLVMKALEKEPERRYATANALADDVDRFLRHEPIEAGPPTRLYRLAKLVRRNRAAIMVAAMVVASLLSGFTVASWQAIRATRAEQLAQQRLNSIRQEQTRTESALAKAESAEQQQRQLRRQAEEREQLSRELVYASDVRLAGQAWRDGDIRTFVDLLERQRPENRTSLLRQPELHGPSGLRGTSDLRGPSDLRGFEWWFLRGQATVDSKEITRGRSGACLARFTLDGRFLVTGHYNGKLHLWDAKTFDHVMTLPGHGSFANWFDLSPDAKTIASAGDDHFIRFWNLESGTELASVKADEGHVHRVFFLADGKELISSGEASEVKRWQRTPLQVMERYTGFETAVHHGIKQRLDISPDRTRCVAADQYQTARVYDLQTGDIVCTLDLSQGQFIRCLKFSPDGEIIAGGRYTQEVTLWDAQTGEVLERFVGHLDDVQDLAFHPKGHLLATSDKSGVVRTWPLRSFPADGDADRDDDQADEGGYRDWPPFFVAHDDRIFSLDFSADGESLVTACRDGTVRRWRAERRPRHPTGESYLEPQSLWIDDDQLIVCGEGHLVFWNLSQGTKQPSETFKDRIQSIAITADRSLIATGHEQGAIRIWELATRKVVKTLQQHQGTIHGLTFSAGDEHLISAGDDGQLLRWEFETGQASPIHVFDHLCKSVAASPTEPLVAAAVQNDIYLFRFDQDAGSIRLRGHQNSADCLVFSPDGRWLASGSDDRTVRLWDVAAGSERRVIHAHQSKIESIAFSPDGRTIASGDKSATLSFSHVATGRFLCSVDLMRYWDDLTVSRTNPWISDLQFSPDGRHLIASLFRVGHLVLQGGSAAGRDTSTSNVSVRASQRRLMPPLSRQGSGQDSQADS